MAKFSDIAPAPAPREWTGQYLDGQEKVAALGTVFVIKHLDKNMTATFGPRWEVGVVDMAGGSEWTITLACNPGRDVQFTALKKALDEGETIDPVVFAIVGDNKKGNPPYGFRDATADEIALAMTDRLALAAEDEALA
jgi:hypothetical protein